MTRAFRALALLLALATVGLAPEVRAQSPLELQVSGGEFRPLPIAIDDFEGAAPGLDPLADEIAGVIAADLTGSGLFRAIPREAFVAQPTAFDTTPQFDAWRTINADALVRGRLARTPDGRLALQFRVFDTAAETQVEGLQLTAPQAELRRLAHKAADAIYTRLTGEGPYFDSRIVFVDERGPKGSRSKSLAVMDQDGANYRQIPGTTGLTLTPRFSPNDRTVLFISYDTGEPQVFLQDLESGRKERLGTFDGMSFAPRFSPDGQRVVFSRAEAGNTDLYALDLGSRALDRLTVSAAIDTSPSFSPDGSQIVFESDRGGSQQLYVMPASGGSARRISFGRGSYGTPVWSPRGDRIAFTKIVNGQFHIGVMRTDGSEERLLSRSFLDEGPTWSPNGRVIMFFRETPGPSGQPQLMSIDITGRNLRQVPTPAGASDPAWSPLRP